MQISPETAIKLSEMLKVPVEHLMHMPQHILLAKLSELSKMTPAAGDTPDASPSGDGKGGE